MIYAVNEVCDYDVQASGSVTAMSLDMATGSLNFMNRASSGGSNPVFASIDPLGRHLAIANYGGGTLSVLGIDQASGAVGALQASYPQGPGSHSAYIRQWGGTGAGAQLHVFAPVFDPDKVRSALMLPAVPVSSTPFTCIIR